MRLAKIATIVLLAAVPAAAAPQDWTRVAVRTPEGGIRVGNPRAAKRIVEIANYTCGHCAQFAEQGGPTLTRAIRAGTLALEIRPIVNHQAGLAATIVARCVPARFLAVNEALYARQPEWTGRSVTYLQANADRLQAYPEGERLRLLAEHGGILAVATAAGAPAARIAACLADPAQLADTLKAVQAAAAIANATPTFIVDGKTYGGLDWTGFARQFGYASR